jgi:hypothetical protein
MLCGVITREYYRRWEGKDGNEAGTVTKEAEHSK